MLLYCDLHFDWYLQSSQPEDTEGTSSGNSVGRSEIKTHNILRRSKRKKKENQDFVFLDRKSLIMNTDEVQQYPEAKSMLEREISPEPDRTLSTRMQEMDLAHQKHSRKVSSHPLILVVVQNYRLV